MKPNLKDVQEERDALSEQMHCADQIIRGMRAKSVFTARHGAVTVLLAAPKAAHGGVVMIEHRQPPQGKHRAPDIRREYGYLERLHASYRTMAAQGFEGSATVYELLGQAMRYRNDLLCAGQEASVAEGDGAGLEMRG